MENAIKSLIIGAGRDIVFLHGWGCNSTHFLSVAKELPGFRAHLLDLPGFGATPEPPSAWDTARYAEAAEAYMDTNRISNPILVGHSFGGRIALHLAAARLADTLILTGGAGLSPVRTLKTRIKSKILHTGQVFVKNLPKNRLIDRCTDAVRNRLGSADYKSASPVMRDILKLAINENLEHLLPNIKARTLLVWGEADTATPVSHARIMKEKISNSKLVVIPDTGHFCFLENPDRFLSEVKEFLK